MTVPPIVIRVDSRDVVPARLRVARIRGRFANFDPVLRGPVLTLLTESLAKQFATEGEWGGNRWVELSERTIEDKRKKGTLGKGILRDTDALLDSLTVPGDVNQELLVTKGQFRLTTKVPYGRAHQRGVPENNLPQRVIIPDPMPAEFIQKLKNIITGYITEVGFA